MQSSSKIGRSNIGLGLAAAAILASLCAGQAHAIAPIGDNSELFVTGTAGATYNDNIFLSHTNATDDLLFDLVPGLSYEFGKVNSLTTGQLAASEDFQLYTTKSQLNNQLFNGTFWTKYDDSKTKLSFDASFHQFDQAERTIQNLNYLVNRSVGHIDGLGEVEVTDKSSLGAGVIWDDTDYKSGGFTDWRYFQIPINYYYKFEPKLDLSAGFQFTDNTVGAGGVDSNVYYYNVGARGEFTPNLTGRFTLGYVDQQMERGKDNRALGADSSFTYAYSPKTNVTFGVSDNYGYAATGSSYRDLGIYVGFGTEITEQWRANGQIAYNDYSYTTTIQKDNFYTIRLGLTYVYSTNISFSGGYNYNYDNSNISLNSFKQNQVSLSATIHY